MILDILIEIAKTMGTALHFNTYGGNPLACTVGSAVLDVSWYKGVDMSSHLH